MAGGTINNSFEEHIHYGEIKIMDNAVETVINGSTEWQGITSNADYGSFSGAGFATLIQGQKIWFGVQNVGASGNITIRSLDLNIHRL